MPQNILDDLHVADPSNTCIFFVLTLTLEVDLPGTRHIFFYVGSGPKGISYTPLDVYLLWEFFLGSL
jgi:hypothetical protein